MTPAAVTSRGPRSLHDNPVATGCGAADSRPVVYNSVTVCAGPSPYPVHLHSRGRRLSIYIIISKLVYYYSYVITTVIVVITDVVTYAAP